MPETNTTKPAAKKIAVSSSVLAAVIADLAAVDLSAAEPPKDDGKDTGRCPHYRSVGVADDDLKRVILLRSDLIDQLSAAKNAQQEEAKRKVGEQAEASDTDGADPFAGIQAMLNIVADSQKPTPEMYELNSRLVLVDALMRQEAERQFPELRGNSFSIGDGWEIGFNDHDSVLEGLRSGKMPAGISIEVIGLGSPRGRDPLEDIFGGILGRGSRRGHGIESILDLFRRH